MASAPTFRTRLIVAYDGTDFFGWQKTKEGPSIEESLEVALAHVLQEPVTLEAASRTDRGVHARGQVVCFTASKTASARAINSQLPPTIRVLDSLLCPLDFHPTLHVRSKEYRYTITMGPVQPAHQRLTSWHVPYELDLPLMKKCCQALIGTRDFAGFCNTKENESYDSTIRTLFHFDLEPIGVHQVEWRVVADHFLYKMARNLVGTTTWIGCGKLGTEALAATDRTRTGVTAPACGLILHQVNYE